MQRRNLLKLGAATAGAVMLAACADRPGGDDDTEVVDDNTSWHMPDEGEPHLRTWMAFGASAEIWGRRLHRKVQQNLGAIAQAIAQFEPVSMLVRPDETELARQCAGPNVELVPVPLDDLWIRDSGPVFVRNESGRAAIDFNFNGWGDKQEHESDARVAGEVAKRAGVPILHTSLIQTRRSSDPAHQPDPGRRWHRSRWPGHRDHHRELCAQRQPQPRPLQD